MESKILDKAGLNGGHVKAFDFGTATGQAAIRELVESCKARGLIRYAPKPTIPAPPLTPPVKRAYNVDPNGYTAQSETSIGAGRKLGEPFGVADICRETGVTPTKANSFIYCWKRLGWIQRQNEGWFRTGSFPG